MLKTIARLFSSGKKRATDFKETLNLKFEDASKRESGFGELKKYINTPISEQRIEFYSPNIFSLMGVQPAPKR